MFRGFLPDSKDTDGKLYGLYRGTIVDNSGDYNRCKIVIEGHHSNSPALVPFESLEWANQGAPLIGDMTNNSGHFSVPDVGAHVFVMFEGGNPRQPVYFAAAIGAPDGETSFFDNFQAKYNINQIGYSDVPNSGSQSNYEYRKTTTESITAIGTSSLQAANWLNVVNDPLSAISSWTPPLPQTPSEPKNMMVFQNSGGCCIEIDGKSINSLTKDKGQQRITISHPGGSYLEYQTDGSSVFMTGFHRYDLTYGNSYKWIGGGEVVNTTGDLLYKSKGYVIETLNYSQKVTGNVGISTTGNETHTVEGFQTNTVLGLQTNILKSQVETLEGSLTQSIDGSTILKYGGSYVSEIEGNVEQNIGGNLIYTVEGSSVDSRNGNYSVVFNGTYELTVDGISNHTFSGQLKQNFGAGWIANAVGSINISSESSTNLNGPYFKSS